MNHIQILELAQLQDATRYERIEVGIFKDLKDTDQYTNHRMAVSMELEEGEDTQYPLEDMLDKYLIHVEEFLEGSVSNKVMHLLLGGSLNALRHFSEILGKRVYNVEYEDQDGKTRIKLAIA